MSTTITFPVPRALMMNANARMHWTRRRKLTAQLRQIARMRGRGIPAVAGKAHVTVTYTYPDRRWPHDEGNLAPTSKALIDGLTDAGLWPDDSWQWVVGPDTRIHRTPDPLLNKAQVQVCVAIKEVPE